VTIAFLPIPCSGGKISITVTTVTANAQNKPLGSHILFEAAADNISYVDVSLSILSAID